MKNPWKVELEGLFVIVAGDPLKGCGLDSDVYFCEKVGFRLPLGFFLVEYVFTEIDEIEGKRAMVERKGWVLVEKEGKDFAYGRMKMNFDVERANLKHEKKWGFLPCLKLLGRVFWDEIERPLNWGWVCSILGHRIAPGSVVCDRCGIIAEKAKGKVTREIGQGFVELILILCLIGLVVLVLLMIFYPGYIYF